MMGSKSPIQSSSPLEHRGYVTRQEKPLLQGLVQFYHNTFEPLNEKSSQQDWKAATDEWTDRLHDTREAFGYKHVYEVLLALQLLAESIGDAELTGFAKYGYDRLKRASHASASSIPPSEQAESRSTSSQHQSLAQGGMHQDPQKDEAACDCQRTRTWTIQDYHDAVNSLPGSASAEKTLKKNLLGLPELAGANLAAFSTGSDDICPICGNREYAGKEKKKTDWIACDDLDAHGGKEVWFHLECVGIDPEQWRGEDDRWYCNECTQAQNELKPRTTRRKPTQKSAGIDDALTVTSPDKPKRKRMKVYKDAEPESDGEYVGNGAQTRQSKQRRTRSAKPLAEVFESENEFDKQPRRALTAVGNQAAPSRGRRLVSRKKFNESRNNQARN